MLPCCCWPLLFFSCSVLRFSLALSGFFFWVFVALKWVWIPCCMSQIIVSEMGSSLLNLILFFSVVFTRKKCYKKKFLAGQHINSALYLYVLSYALIIVYCCKWMFVGFRQNKLATWWWESNESKLLLEALCSCLSIYDHKKWQATGSLSMSPLSRLAYDCSSNLLLLWTKWEC